MPLTSDPLQMQTQAESDPSKRQCIQIVTEGEQRWLYSWGTKWTSVKKQRKTLSISTIRKWNTCQHSMHTKQNLDRNKGKGSFHTNSGDFSTLKNGQTTPGRFMRNSRAWHSKGTRPSGLRGMLASSIDKLSPMDIWACQPTASTC